MRNFLLSACLVASAISLQAGIIFTREAPRVQQTSVVGAAVETFDSLTAGPLGVYNSPIGTYSSGGQIVVGNAYGGSNQSLYVAVGAQSDTVEMTLTFATLKAYFGFYWPAGDALNRLDFYQGNVLLATFSVGDIIGGLPAEYFGNPNTGVNETEPYVFLNFTSSDLNSRFDRVVFRNISTITGFESDNHSTFDDIPDDPEVPEPSTYAMMASGLAGLIFFARRRASR